VVARKPSCNLLVQAWSVKPWQGVLPAAEVAGCSGPVALAGSFVGRQQQQLAGALAGSSARDSDAANFGVAMGWSFALGSPLVVWATSIAAGRTSGCTINQQQRTCTIVSVSYTDWDYACAEHASRRVYVTVLFGFSTFDNAATQCQQLMPPFLKACEAVGQFHCSQLGQ
jgi:hypothetical protein